MCVSRELTLISLSVCVCVQSVASIGSTVTSVQHDVSMIQSVVEERRKGEDQLKDVCFTLLSSEQYFVFIQMHSVYVSLPKFRSETLVEGIVHLRTC